jgi:tetratricopeptide (TPR) repeat protein
MLYTPNIRLLEHLMSEAYDEGNLMEALVHAKHIYQLVPSYRSFFDYSLLAKELGYYRQALTTLRRAIDIDPLHPDAHIEKALVLYELDLTQEAYDYLLSLRSLLLEETPWALLAVLAGELNHLDEALFYANKALAHLSDAWSYHAMALVLQMRGSYDLASDNFQLALSQDPYNSELWNSYGLHFEKTLAFHQALEVYNTAINHFHLTTHFLYLNRAKMHHILDLKDKAIIDCELALEQIDDSGDIWFLYASLLHESNDLPAALAAYNQSLRYIKKDASIHFCKAQVLEALGRIRSAKASYERALKFAPGNVDMRLAFVNFLLKHNLSLPLTDLTDAEKLLTTTARPAKSVKQRQL